MHRYLIILLLLWSAVTKGQEYRMDANLPTINDCNGFFTDSGGSTQAYQNNENFSTIICKDPQEGTHIRLTFANIDLAPGDKLCFYDGLSTASDSLICIESFFNGVPIIVQATAANPSGCLTVTFRSNNTVTNEKGWQASIDCVPSCQLIQAVIENTSPKSVPLERGYIDICQGERVFFNGNALYPQNNLVYEHNATTSTFEWDFGDGSFAVGNNVSHSYNQPGGYQVTLTITDQFGCTNGNFAFQRVRVATKPTFKIGELPEQICVGETIQLNGNINETVADATIAVCNQEGAFLFNGVRSDSLALPDGNGASYKTSIRFTDFEAGQILTDIRDLQSICLNMEHSWLHDMEISITCPSGNTVKLQSQEVINKEVYLGIPIDNDGITPQSGRGLDYCWTPFSTNGTLTEFSNENDDTSPNETYHLPAGDFNSFEDLEALLGCPLNGDWIITVTDLWEQDNGWIFSWSIDINPALYPDLETFEPRVTNAQWQNNPDFINVSANEVVAQPTSAGTASYTFEVADDFGCTHDTAVQIMVLPNNHPECLNCEDHLLIQDSLTICPEEPINLGNFIDPYALGVVEFKSFPEYEFSRSTHPPQNPYETPIQVSNIPGNEINTDGSNLISVCLNLTSEFNSDLAITLISPNGVHLNLSSENGGRNDGYINTCFTAMANRSITDPSDGPFMGNYFPEEPFSNLAGTDLNGIWKLQLSDDAGFAETDVNVLKSWSMTFLAPSNATFNWTPSEILSCNNCTNPVATPSESTNYILEKNFEGCQVFDTLHVKVLGEDRPTEIKEVSLADGNLLVTWGKIVDIDNYEVSTNSEDWLPANNGATAHIFGGLTQNETFNVYVRGVYGDFPCPTKFTSRAVRYRFCDLSADLGSRNLVTNCADTDDAFVVIVADGGAGGYSYTLNDLPSQFNNRFERLTVGNYQVFVEDNQSCADTLNFTITAPPPLSLSFDKIDLDCFGDDNGTTTIFPTGGVGDYQVLEWSHSASKDFSANNLTQGLYWVEVADANNCVIRDSFEINEPTELQAIATESPVSCFGASDGKASVKVTDGTAPYSFIWDDGQTGVSALGLQAGNYSVTVEDAKNCKTIRTITVTQPRELMVTFQEEAISCTDEMDGNLLAVVEGGLPPYEYKWNTGQTNQFNFGLGADQYLLTITDSKGCGKIATTQLTAPNALVLSTSFTPPSCENNADGSATVNVVGGTGMYNFLWSDSATQTTQTAINLKPDSYEVTVSDENGCHAIQQVTVNSATSISTSFSINPASCTDRADGSVTVTVVNGSGDYTYLWSNGNTSNTNTQLLPGQYTVTIQDGNACAIIDTIEIASPSVLRVDSIQQIMPTCHGTASGILEAFVSGGTAPYNYNWDNDLVTTNPYTGASAGNHALSVVDANGCIVLSQNINLVEPPILEATTVLQNVKCFNGDDGSVMITTSGGITPYNFLWDDEINKTTSIASGLVAGEYTVTVTDANDCVLPVSFTINQPFTPLSSQIIQTDTACFNQNQNKATVLSSGGTGPNYRFEWSHGATSAFVNNLPAGNYEVSIYDENNCQRVDAINIIELDSITFSIIEVKPSCHNSADGRLTITPITGGGGNGEKENYQINWSTNPNSHQEVIINLLGDADYQVTVTDQIGCSQAINRFLEAPDPVFLRLNEQDISCFGANDGQLSVDSITDNSPISMYEWSINIPPATTNIANNLAAGNYSLSITNEDGCSALATATIEEPQALVIETVEIFPNICSDASLGRIELSASGGIGELSYEWSNGDNRPNLTNVPSGQYKVNIKDANNCVLVDSFNLNDPDALKGNIETEAVSCLGEADGQIRINPTGGVPPYVYSLNDETYDGIQNIIGLSAGNYKVSIKDNNNCIWQSNTITLQNPLPFEVEIRSSSNIINLGESINLTAKFSNNTGNVQYDWIASTPNTFECSEELCSSITITPTVNTSYELYAVDANGCEAGAILNILVAKNKNIFVPTGFTPNGDGKNDFLIVHGAPGTILKSFKLFDRWGETIFESTEMTPNNTKNTWDGTFKGQPLNSGVYVWVLEVSFGDGTTEVFKGSTSLIR